MNAAQKSFQLAQIGMRRLTTSSVVRTTCPANSNVHPGYKKLQEKMKKFQVDDGIPVHLKGGALDKILYQATAVLCVIGLGMSVHLFYEMSYPKQN